MNHYDRYDSWKPRTLLKMCLLQSKLKKFQSYKGGKKEEDKLQRSRKMF
jgi:hypothetical protein